MLLEGRNYFKFYIEKLLLPSKKEKLGPDLASFLEQQQKTKWTEHTKQKFSGNGTLSNVGN